MIDYFKENVPSNGNTEGNKRSIRNITMPQGSNKRFARSSQNGSSSRGGIGKKIGIWSLSVLSILVLFVVVFSTFQETKVLITPRTHSIVFDEGISFTAYPTKKDGNEGEVPLVYDVIRKEFTESEKVPSSGSEHAEVRASGKIKIYNEYSSSKLKLIKNTRFETPTGLVYKIRNSVVVPGGSASNPGTLDVTVYADEAGEKYNIGPIDRFTLPGLKDTASEMYKKVYAKSDKKMSGGFVGQRPTVDENAMQTARDVLRAKLKTSAESAFLKDTKDTTYVIKDLLNIDYESAGYRLDSDGNAIITEKAIVSVPTIDSHMFAKAVSRATSADTQDGTVVLKGTDTFKINVIGNGIKLGISPIDFSLSGTAEFMWKTDPDALSVDLAGKDKNAFQTVLGGYPGIEKADAKIRPFWAQSFPKNANDIVVEFVKDKIK